MDFLEKLSLLMRRDGYNKSSLSKACGIPYTTIDNWFKRGYDGLQLSTLKKLNNFFHTTLEFWARDEITDPNYGKSDGFKVDFSEMSHIKKYRTLDEHGKEIVKSVLDIEVSRIKAEQQEEPDEPQIVDIMHFLTPASAGTGMIVYEVGEFENLQVLSNAYTRQADYCVTVRGNSMEPRFHDGDLVMVKEQDDIEFGEIGVFVVDGNSYIKQKGDDRLISLNKSVPDVYINPYHSFDCQGRVIGVLDPDWIIK